MSNTKAIKDYLHLYIGCQVIDSEGDIGTLKGVCQSEVERRKLLAIVDFGGEVFFELYTEEVQMILRPLSDMTEEEFKEFAKPKSFAVHDGYWYACNCEVDSEWEDAVIEHINSSCDDDPKNVIMCNIRSKHISYGWIEYEERYHGFGVKEEAEWVRFLLSKDFDLFGLIEAGLAIDATKQPKP